MVVCLERLWEYEGYFGVGGTVVALCFTRAKYCEQLFFFLMDWATIRLDSSSLSLLRVFLLYLFSF